MRDTNCAATVVKRFRDRKQSCNRSRNRFAVVHIYRLVRTTPGRRQVVAMLQIAKTNTIAQKMIALAAEYGLLVVSM